MVRCFNCGDDTTRCSACNHDDSYHCKEHGCTYIIFVQTEQDVVRHECPCVKGKRESVS